MKGTTSIATGPRESNFELLRIVAMFLVLVTHADYVSIGLPKSIDILSSPANAITRLSIESISVVCVNLFILISGWFGIRAHIKGLCNFLFQCAFFLIGTYVFSIIIGFQNISSTGLMSCLVLTRSWFIPAYLGLYILSPLINVFLEQAGKRRLELFLIAFYCFQTYFGTLRSVAFIEDGYSTFSFIGLYCLGRYLKMYGKKIFHYGWLLYLLSIVANTMLYILKKEYFEFINVYNYINPFVVIGAVGLFIIFANMKISHNRVINFISKSSFAVFLLHTSYSVYPVFIDIVRNIYENYTGLSCMGIIFCFLILVFAISVLCDLPRRALWNWIATKINWSKFRAFLR